MHKKIGLILISGALVAACGGSSKNHDPASSGAKSYSQALAFSRCMREHGVANFPDPTSSGGGIQLTINHNSGINPLSPAFQAAQSACCHLMPGAGPVSPQASAQARAQLLQISECMRAHGISGFPDPTTSPPAPGQGGFGFVFGHDGAFIAVPSSINPRSPAFQQAAAACNFGPRGGLPKGQ